ncbi:hypothetical protein [Picosynechococcus sp. PCC 7117]|uniref:CIS tube protein n=1 Tax=Picosynechococcus sp. PCC 7117 TaxID=195498 RepID=UPI000810BF36|nr:hypothetical protein [Picosynechococcus sp. PCC 7117]ANV88498.1 hypothetical protein AWQ22_14080 [Picosynechococcus sp. PCC 7117]
MINEQLLNKLEAASKVEGIFAHLADLQGNVVAEFLFNPEQKYYSRSARYAEGVAALTSLPSQQYQYSSGLELNLSNLLLQTHSQGKTVKSIIQGIQDLMVADPINEKYTPTPVKFVWGSDSFGPCVVTNLNWNETAWLDGLVADARLDIKLLEIPDPSTRSPQQAQQGTPNTNPDLTDREKSTASTKANEWLKSNTSKLNSTLAPIVKANRYRLLTSNQGRVSILDAKNNVLGIVGDYINGSFNTDSNNIQK